jgi:hypothetical protein
MKSRVARSREGDPDHWIQAMGEPLDQNLHVVSHIGGSGVERVSFRLQKSRSVERRGLMRTHVSHPLGGDHVVDRWHKHRAPRERWK